MLYSFLETTKRNLPMDYEKLRSFVEGVNGTTFVGLDTMTVPKLKGGKKNTMQGRVEKVTLGANTMIFSNTSCSGYENMVKKRMVAEGKDPAEFTVGKRAWGTRVGNSCFIEHNGKHYIEVFFISPGETQYLLDGKQIEKADVEGLTETKPSESSQGGIENKVVIRTFAVDSILAVRAKGETLE